MRWLAETKVAPEFLSTNAPIVPASTLSESERKLWTRFSSESELRIDDVGLEPEGDFWGQSILIHNTSSSQFDLLTKCSRNGVDLPDSLACIALSGSGFHGNRNRDWKALPGNLHFSSFCRVALDAAECGPTLSMLPTVAVTDVIRNLSSRFGDRNGGAPVLAPWIKWVNDVYIGESKISGSLVSSQVEGEQITSIVLGIGLNVAASPHISGKGLFGDATCLFQQGLQVDLPAVFRELFRALAIRIPQLSNTNGRKNIF